MYRQALRALQNWCNPHPAPDLLEDLVRLHHLLPDAVPQAQGPPVPPLHRVLEIACRRLEYREPEMAQLLRWRFQDRITRAELAKRFLIHISAVDKRQRRAVEALAQVLSEMAVELQQRADEGAALRKAALRARVDQIAEPTPLFGVAPYLQQLHEWLASPGPPQLVVIQGIGGIGKTALAAAYVRQALELELFAGIAWTTARTVDLFPDGSVHPRKQAALGPKAILADLMEQVVAPEQRPLPFRVEAAQQVLAQVLRQAPYLLVVDNLETVPQITELLRLLAALMDTRAKFLLTTRHTPRTSSLFASLHLAELPLDTAGELLRYLGRSAGLPELAQASPTTVRAVYRVVGGNPLALRLLVGQSRLHPLARVLAALEEAQGKAAEHLYTFIYRRAWSLLTPDEQALFLSMVAVPPEGAEADYIATLSDFPTSQAQEILDRLVALSLVDLRAGPETRRYYAIHSLTRTFLHTQILQWPQCAPPPIRAVPGHG